MRKPTIRLIDQQSTCNLDVHVLLRVGVLQKSEEGGVEFPYYAIHVDFLLKAA
jgi:hypothetical protein